MPARRKGFLPTSWYKNQLAGRNPSRQAGIKTSSPGGTPPDKLVQNPVLGVLITRLGGSSPLLLNGLKLIAIIESLAISGQKAYQVGVDQALRKHIQLSQPPEPMSEQVESAGGAGNSGGGVGAGLGVGGVKAKGERGRPISMAQAGRSGTVKGTPESRPSDTNRTSSKIGSGSGTAVVSLFGLELSWMMLGSIGLVFLLLFWNLLLSFSPPRHHRKEPLPTSWHVHRLAGRGSSRR
ncbi:hypothetical protein PGTUg99_014816 [Puccinia graminis f. sp. tritici]|uniref:Uncharacterized protein n=1 Tax=Puccinia graminis f. sp. tritici TaxID=56615 RepID=A0A5B0RLA8_PUCGR|nr:hypothetical protein PGTUg99_014816 [Puccinia graminis f. sp. tritici]